MYIHQAWCRCIYVVYIVVCVLNLFEFKFCVPRIILLNIRAICGLPDISEDYQIFQPGSPADYQIFGVISTPVVISFSEKRLILAWRVTFIANKVYNIITKHM